MWKITSKYGASEPFRNGDKHSGIDLNFKSGDELISPVDGIIHIKDFGNANAGKTILVEMKNGQTAIFGHLSDFNVSEGQRVSCGELIGWSGNTGFSTGDHLHVGLKQNGHFVDPSAIVDSIQSKNSCIVEKTLTLGDYLKGSAPDLGSLLKNISVNLINMTDHLFAFVVNNAFVGEYLQNIIQLFS